jgi:hypothetical protein
MINAPSLVTTFQIMAVVAAGFGIAVQFYHVPSLVGATFGADKGLFSAYTDGVAYGPSLRGGCGRAKRTAMPAGG